MIPETKKSQEAKRVYPGKPARHALADPGRYFTQDPHCWLSRGTAQSIVRLESTRVNSKSKITDFEITN